METMFELKQNTENIRLISTKKTVDWLVKNTVVSEFDPITFTGYQRQIDKNHCYKIITYIEQCGFYLPTAIILATDSFYCGEGPLRIVDGQHRIQAFRMICCDAEKQELYYQIRDKEIAVIVIQNLAQDERIEIDTFISINKTSKKVDTSLAFVLRNKLNSERNSEDLTISRREYISVEVARLLSVEESHASSVWNNKILFEGNVKNTPQTISLNAFVKATKALLANIEKRGVVVTRWSTKSEIEEQVSNVADLIDVVWEAVREKLPELFSSNIEDRSIIQGSIGYSSVSRYLSYRLKYYEGEVSALNIKKLLTEWIGEINTSPDQWKAGVGRFSKFSSESGYTIVARELLASAGISEE